MCLTKHAKVWQELSEPFPDGEIKFLPKGGKKMAYITARAVMNRLDSVLGPENWWDAYQPNEHSVECRLTVKLPDGQTVTKVDAGAYAGMSDQGDDDKSGYSDAFKRAAVKFGIGRHLYGDGIPDFYTPPSEFDSFVNKSAKALKISEEHLRIQLFNTAVNAAKTTDSLERSLWSDMFDSTWNDPAMVQAYKETCRRLMNDKKVAA